jgi:hypothetical protein
MSASEDLLSALAAFYAETIQPDVEGIVRASTRRLRSDVRRQLHGSEERLRGELREMEGRLRFDVREGDRQVRADLLASIDELRRDMSGHLDAVHQKLGHLETEYRMLVVGVRRLEASRPQGGEP